MRQWGFIVGLADLNGLMAYDYFVNKFHDRPKWSTKAEYIHSVMKELITNDEWEEEKHARARNDSVMTPENKRLRVMSPGQALGHEKATIPAGRLRWNGTEFPVVSPQRYQKSEVPMQEQMWQGGQNILYLQYNDHIM